MTDEYGYPIVDPEKKVCARCFGDEGIKQFISTRVNARQCSFCHRKSRKDIAAPLIVVVAHLQQCLAQDYSSPDDAGMVYESREGGYQGTVWETGEFLQEEVQLELPNDSDGSLLNALCDGLGDQLWSSSHLYRLSETEQLAYSWENFCRLIKHKRRFFFLSQERKFDDDEILTPGEMLRTIIDHAEKVDLVRHLPKGQQYFRVRRQLDCPLFKTAATLGPPPEEDAIQTNRMSPAGIVMTYVSEELSTALRETVSDPGLYAYGIFETQRDIRILDLASLPPIPSYFAEIHPSLEFAPRRVILFLDEVARDMSKPIARDDKVHVEYVPTQVVTEFVRSSRSDGDKRVDGIRYRSSRKPDGVSLVLFAATDNLVPSESDPKPLFPQSDPWLKLVKSGRKTVTAGEIAKWG